MKAGDYVQVPRFGGIKIDKVFKSQMEALAEGYVEPTHYHKDGYGVYGKHVESNENGWVKFAWGAYREE